MVSGAPFSGELVLPPLSPVLVGRPYAAVPLLAAYAEQRGAAPVRQTNLNQAYVRHLLLDATDDQPRTPVGAGDEAAEAERSLLAAYPAAVAERPTDAALLAAIARDPAAQPWLFDRAGLVRDSGEPSDVDVASCIAGLARLAGMRAFFTRFYRSRTLPRLVGISVPFATQLAPALLLASVLRELAGDELFVVLGGPLPSLVEPDQIDRILRDTEVDGVVRREGEESFQQLLALPGFTAEHLAGVPALTFLAGGRRGTGPADRTPRKLDDTAPRRLDDEYIDGAVELPVMVGRGCFYTCAFCDYIELYEKINFRKAEAITNSAELAAGQSTTGALHFVYEVMSLRYERKLARVLAERDLGIQWRGFQRVYGELTAEDVRLLERSGCVRLDVGLESADDEALRLMNKGYDRAEIGNFLRAFAGSPIQLLINIIVDYPGLTYDRAMAAAEFLAEATRDIGDVHFEVLRFMLGSNSAMGREPDRFGLEVVGHAGDGDGSVAVVSPTQIAFRSHWAMSDAERDRVEAFYRNLNASFRARRVDAVLDSGLLSGSEPATGRWTLRVEPLVLAATGAGDVVVRRLAGRETFVLPADYLPLLRAYQRLSGRTAELAAFVAAERTQLTSTGVSVVDCLEVLAQLDLLVATKPRERVRVGISSDRNFYRGGVRASSPGVAG